MKSLGSFDSWRKYATGDWSDDGGSDTDVGVDPFSNAADASASGRAAADAQLRADALLKELELARGEAAARADELERVEAEAEARDAALALAARQLAEQRHAHGRLRRFTTCLLFWLALFTVHPAPTHLLHNSVHLARVLHFAWRRKHFKRVRLECVERTRQPYRALVLEGGGVKGIAYGGAIRALEDAGFVAGVENFAGSSAGAQAAALLAAGYSGSELTRALLQTRFEELLDGSSMAGKMPNPLGNWRRLQHEFGWFKGRALERRIDELLQAKTNATNTTFAELLAQTGKRLRLSATGVSTASLQWLDAESTPDVPIATAVHASSAIPFFYTPVEIDGIGLIVDGGVLRNLPFDAFDDIVNQRTGRYESWRQAGRASGGLRGAAKDDGDGDGAARPPPHQYQRRGGALLALSIRSQPYLDENGRTSVRDLVSFASQLLDTVMYAHGNVATHRNGNMDFIHIDTGNISFTNFDLSPEDKAFLVRSGYIAVSRRLHECGHTRERLEPAWLTDDSLVHLAVSKGEANFMDHFYAPGDNAAALPGLPGLLGLRGRDDDRDEL